MIDGMVEILGGSRRSLQLLDIACMIASARPLTQASRGRIDIQIFLTRTRCRVYDMRYLTKWDN
jgi:hypothetical protein